MGPSISASPGELAALRSLTLEALVPGDLIVGARKWGPCAYHARLLLAMECARFHRDLRSPAALYCSMMRRAEREFHQAAVRDPVDFADRIDDASPCPVCESPATGVSDERMNSGALARGAMEFQRFREETSAHWRQFVCATCGGERRAVRCRLHLACDLRSGERPDMVRHRRTIEAITGHLIRYARSFDWHHRGSETAEDRAALVAAIGWCTGWRHLIGGNGDGPC